MSNPMSAHSDTSNDRPEAAVVDEIDRLVSDSLEAGDCSRAWSEPLADRCPRCGWEWHGLDNGSCPGPYAEVGANETGGVTQGQFIDQVIDVTYGFTRDQVRQMVAETAMPEQIVAPWVVYTDEPPPVASVPGPLFMFPSESGQTVPALRGAPLVDALHEELVHHVVAMIGEVMGIYLPDNDTQTVIDTVKEMTQAARENRERRDRIRLTRETVTRLLAHYEAAPSERYTPDHADNSGEAMQRLQSRRDHLATLISDDGRWTVTTGTTVRDAPPGDEAAQQDSGSRESRDQDLRADAG